MRILGNGMFLTEGDGYAKIYFDDRLYRINEDEIRLIATKAVVLGKAIDFETRRLRFGEITLFYNPTFQTAKGLNLTIGELINHISNHAIA